MGIKWEFEMDQIKMYICDNCKLSSLTKMVKKKLSVTPYGGVNYGFVCNSCNTNYEKYSVNNYIVPYWIDDEGTKHTDIPNQLIDLTYAEKQLIALASSHMNLVHLKNGTLGSTGHVVALEQDLSEIAMVLPRLPDTINVIKILRKGVTKDQDTYQKMFKVRRSKVINALKWLVKYNVLYRQYNVHVNEKNLDWMDGQEEALLPIKNDVMTGMNEAHDDGDMGPSVAQTLMSDIPNVEADYEMSGSLLNLNIQHPTLNDRKILSEIKNATKGSNKNIVVNWPAFSDKPISEYGNKKVFCMLYPWLYPGGNGDFLEDRSIDVSPQEWAKHQMHYYDNRFAGDKTWCFYAQNYIQRRRNQDQGGWFVKSFHNDENIESVSDLQKKLQKEGSKFVSKLQYFSKNVPGSDSFWRQKKHEIFAWISYHISIGNGAPSFFITLSCAEYHWKHLEILINE